MYRYTGHHEIRFKITDQEAKLFQDTANYFYYEKHILQKPNIQELARWCIKQTVNASQDLVIQSKLAREQQHQQQLQQLLLKTLTQQVQQKSSRFPTRYNNLQQQVQQNQQQKQQQRLPTIDDILAEEERRILADLESLFFYYY
jgi:acyl carrier protein phosphodiesterase